MKGCCCLARPGHNFCDLLQSAYLFGDSVWFESSVVTLLPYIIFVFLCHIALLLVCCSVEFCEYGLDMDCIVEVETFLTS